MKVEPSRTRFPGASLCTLWLTAFRLAPLHITCSSGMCAGILQHPTRLREADRQRPATFPPPIGLSSTTDSTVTNSTSLSGTVASTGAMKTSAIPTVLPTISSGTGNTTCRYRTDTCTSPQRNKPSTDTTTPLESSRLEARQTSASKLHVPIRLHGDERPVPGWQRPVARLLAAARRWHLAPGNRRHGMAGRHSHHRLRHDPLGRRAPRASSIERHILRHRHRSLHRIPHLRPGLAGRFRDVVLRWQSDQEIHTRERHSAQAHVHTRRFGRRRMDFVSDQTTHFPATMLVDYVRVWPTKP